jgi:hypothetical protein
MKPRNPIQLRLTLSRIGNDCSNVSAREATGKQESEHPRRLREREHRLGWNHISMPSQGVTRCIDPVLLNSATANA